MILIAGLGNPGKEYENTPHNAGFMFVDSFREFIGWDSLYEINDWEYDKYLKSEISIAKISGEPKIAFLKPQMFMNNSGGAVHAAMQRFELKNKSFVLAHDDLDIELGSQKVQLQKSPKDHKGVDSVQRLIGADFLRVRIGVDNRAGSEVRIPGEDYVLQKYNNEELQILDESIASASRSLRTTLQI